MPKKIEISHKTIIFTIIFLLFLWFIVQIGEIISWFFISFILMSALKPIVDYLNSIRIPRILAIILVYICILIIFGFIASTIIPPLVTQTLNLSQSLPEYLRLVLPSLNLDPQNFAEQISSIGSNVLQLSVGLFNNIVSLFTIMVISFYLLFERNNLETYLSLFLGKSSGGKIEAIFAKVEERLGAWVRGQLTLILCIGILTYIGLFSLQIPYALPLAIIAGLLEIIPTLGPILASLPAIIVAFTVSSLHPVFTIILYFVIQQLENQIIVPVVMSKIVGLPPLVIILAILVGARLAGIAGVILAVPVVVTAETVFRAYYQFDLATKKPAEAHKPDSV